MLYTDYLDSLALRLSQNDLIELSDWHALSFIQKRDVMKSIVATLQMLSYGGVVLPHDLELDFTPFNQRVKQEYRVKYNKDYYDKVNELYSSSLKEEMQQVYDNLVADKLNNDLESQKPKNQPLDVSEDEGYNVNTLSMSDFSFGNDLEKKTSSFDTFNVGEILEDTSAPTYNGFTEGEIASWVDDESLVRDNVFNRPIITSSISSDFKQMSRRISQVSRVKPNVVVGNTKVVNRPIRKTKEDIQADILEGFTNKVLSILQGGDRNGY